MLLSSQLIFRCCSEPGLLQHRKTDDDPPGPEWVAVPGPAGMMKEVKERKVKSREEREERVETEDIQHLGDLTDEVSTTFTLMVTFYSYEQLWT